MSKLDELFSNASMECQAQIRQILESGKPIESRGEPSTPVQHSTTIGGSGAVRRAVPPRFKSKITDLERIDFTDYENAKQLEDHLKHSGFKPHTPGVVNIIQRFFESDHGKSTVNQTTLEDLY